MVTELDTLQVRYPDAGPIPVVNGVSLGVDRGEVVALLGPSGSGKSTVARFLVGAAEEHGAVVTWERFVPPKRPAMVEQEARASLHPLLRVGRQLRDCLTRRGETPGELLATVGLDPAVHARRYPHQLSGGEAQRVAIARALALKADLIVADEITAGLDVVAASRVLRTIRAVVDSMSAGCLLVTHDLEVCRATADRVLVLRSGTVVEKGSPQEVYSEPPWGLL